GNIFQLSDFGAGKFFFRIIPTLCIDYELSIAEELISYIDSSIDISTRIVTEIQDELLDTVLLFQGYHRIHKFAIGLCRKPVNTNIGHTRLDKIGLIYAF